MRVGQVRERERCHYLYPAGLPSGYSRCMIISRCSQKCCKNPAIYWQAHRFRARINRNVCSSEVPVTIPTGLRKGIEPLLRRIFHLYWRIARGMTLGVRGVVLDGENRVFLVKHSYVAGWHLPGGGVEVGQTFREALERELAEEGRIELVGEPTLHGLFFNSHVSPRDHVAVYVVRRFSQDRLPEPNHEIVACGFFDAAALPAETTPGTRRRIAEVLDGKQPIATWR
jgi:8-oxo-dGTP pyrophosphatase MutT (NUDIX family)